MFGMKLCTVKSSFRYNTFQIFVILIFLFTGSGIFAASLYQHYKPIPRVNPDTLQLKKNALKDSLYKAFHAARG